MNKVSIVRIEESLEESVEKALSLIHWEESLKGKEVVVVKPNLCDVEYIRGAVTNPEVVGVLVGLLRDRISEVFVGESDGYFYSADQAFTDVGMRDVVEKAGGTVVNFSKDELVEVKCEEALYLKKIEMPKTLVEAELLVNAPVMKTHEVTLYTGAIKNLFGCIPSNRRILLHSHLDEVLVDLVRILGDQIILMDATTGMEGNGPAKGIPVEMNLLLAGFNPIAVDDVVTNIISIKKNAVGHIKLAKKNMEYDENKLNILGESIEEVNRPFLLPYIDLSVKIQLLVFRSYLLTYLCFNTPLFNLLKIGSNIHRFSSLLLRKETYKSHRSRF